MAQGSTKITIKINGKEVENNIYAIRKAVRELNTDVNKLNRDSEEYNQAVKELGNANKILNEHGEKVRGVNKSWQAMKDNIKSAGIVMLGYFGVTTFFSKITNAMQGAAKISDVMADVQRTTGMTADETERLRSELSQIDSRTATVDLLELAKAGGKLGIAENDILGFVKAADQINVALGEDLGKDAITAIGKIVNIFHLKDQFGLEEAMLKVGSAINSAGQASEAQEGYIVDFLNRMGGIAPLANISATSIIGMAATLDSLGQTSEVSSTALSKLFTKMAADAETYAKFAGMDVQEFIKTLNEDAMEALLRVLEGANQTSGGIVTLTETLGEMDIEGGRAVGVFGTLANNTDRLRKEIDGANKSFVAGTSITQEYTVKNQTLGAAMDKLMKQINGFVANSALTRGLTAIVMLMGDTRTEVEKTNAAYEMQKNKTAELEKNIDPLVKRYDELKTKGFLNNIEQAELNSIIQKISNLLPTAATHFDEYGNAIDISTDKVKAAIEKNKELVQAMGEKEIKALLGQVKSLRNETSILQDQLNEGGVTEKVKDFDPKTFDTWFRRFDDEEMKSVTNEMIRGNKEMYDALIRLRDEFQETLSADQITFISGFEKTFAAVETIATAQTEDEKRKAEEEAARMAEQTKQKKEEAKRRAEEFKRQTEQLDKFIKDKSRELLLFGLDANAKELKQIENKYADEIELAKGHSEQIKLIEELRTQELEIKRKEHQRKLIQSQAEFNEDFWLMLQDEELKAVAAIDKIYEAWWARMVEANLATAENWELLKTKWADATAKFDAAKFAALGEGLAKGLQAMFSGVTTNIDTQVDYTTKKYRELKRLAAEGDQEAMKVLENVNDMLADQAAGYFLAGQAAASSVELQKLSLKDLLNVIRQQIKAYIAQAIAQLVGNILATAPPLLSIVLATTAGFAASALFDKLIPEFAIGGYTEGEKIYKAGEAGREYIAPNKQLNDPVTGPVIKGLEYHRTTGKYPDWMSTPTAEPNMGRIYGAINSTRQFGQDYFGGSSGTSTSITNNNFDRQLMEQQVASMNEFNTIMRDMQRKGIRAYLNDDTILRLQERQDELENLNNRPEA